MLGEQKTGRWRDRCGLEWMGQVALENLWPPGIKMSRDYKASDE